MKKREIIEGVVSGLILNVAPWLLYFFHDKFYKDPVWVCLTLAMNGLTLLMVLMVATTEQRLQKRFDDYAKQHGKEAAVEQTIKGAKEVFKHLP